MSNTIVNLNELIELNQLLEQRGTGFRVHLHDHCQSQSFSIEAVKDKPVAAAKPDIQEYFQKKGLSLRFFNEDQEFCIM